MKSNSVIERVRFVTLQSFYFPETSFPIYLQPSVNHLDEVYQKRYTWEVVTEPQLKVVFYKSLTDKEPVRDWLKDLPLQDKRILGEDIKTV